MPAARRRRPTIQDVAHAAGVSPTTVSHALNGKGRVDARTRARVERAARRLGYRASRTATALRSGRTGTLGLMLPEGAGLVSGELIGVDFYLELAAAATRAAFARSHAIALLPPVGSADELRQFALDGAIVNDPASHDPRIDAFEALGLPVVTIDRDLGRPELRSWVASDNAANTRSVLDHLAAAGAERIGLLTADSDWSWLVDTEREYTTWCAERGAEPIVERAPLAALRTTPVANARALLDREPRPDAVLSAPERFAVAMARAASERGLRLGRDMLLAAGVDSAQARDNDPPITVVDLRPDLQAAAAVDLLLALIDGEETDAPIIVPGELRPRASTGAR
jgi:DNA-binding LacI/PurR family transcriptional regulator